MKKKKLKVFQKQINPWCLRERPSLRVPEDSSVNRCGVSQTAGTLPPGLHLVLPYLCSPAPNAASCWAWQLTCNPGIKSLKHETRALEASRLQREISPQTLQPKPSKQATPQPRGAISPEAAKPFRSQARSRFFCGVTTKITLLIHACSGLLSVSCWENSIRAGTSPSNLPRTPGTPRRAQLGNAACVLPSLNNPTMALSSVVETFQRSSSKDFPFARHVERVGPFCFYRCGNQGPDHV